MGNWIITITGNGPHHTPSGATPNDANIMAVDIVKSLKEKGHTVKAATFTYESHDNVLAVAEQSATPPTA